MTVDSEAEGTGGCCDGCPPCGCCLCPPCNGSFDCGSCRCTDPDLPEPGWPHPGDDPDGS